MEDNKGVLEINEGKDEIRVMIPASSNVETRSISKTTKKLGPSRFTEIDYFQEIPTPGGPASNDTSSSYMRTMSTSMFSGVKTEDEDEKVYEATKKLNLQRKKFKKKMALSFVGCIFVCLVGILIASLTVHKLKGALMRGLELWKWIVFILVIFCGGLISKWLINILVFFIKRTGLRKEFVYFVNEMQKSVRTFVWLGLIFLAWILLINQCLKRSKDATKILDHVTNALGGCLIGAAIWLIKSFLIELLASSFQSGRFFNRIQKSVFDRYVVRVLSGRPLIVVAESYGLMSRFASFRTANSGKTGKQESEIDVEKLHRIKQDKMSAWTMNALINEIIRSGLSINVFKDVMAVDTDVMDMDSEINMKITTEMEALSASYMVFKNVAKPGSKYIEEEDLRRFMIKEEVDLLFRLFPGAEETGKIDRSSFKKWMVDAYKENNALVQSLSYPKKALEKLNRLASGIVIVIGIVVACLMMGILTAKVLFFISSQILLITFMFGNTAKTVFEAVVFVFIMHPFDVGDQCAIDGEQMLVEEINILQTIFCRNDMQKIFYPNAILLGKPILNSFRNPEMDDLVEFSIDRYTPAETINYLKEGIKRYLECKPKHWLPNHNVVVKDIDSTGNLKMALCVTHKINFQNSGEKSSRRSDLILELKRIFEHLNIKYRLLPQEVHFVQHVGFAPPGPSAI